MLPLDVADADAVEHAAETVERELGPIDVWINNAMVSVYSPIKEMPAAEFRRVTEVTYLGYVHGTLAALKRMLPRDRGIIIQVGSALAHRSIPLQSAYCAAKHAIMGFHESLLSELIHDGSHVRTTMVQMPAMNTPQFDWAKSRLPRPDAAGAADLPAGGRRRRGTPRGAARRRSRVPRRVADGQGGARREVRSGIHRPEARTRRLLG